MTRAGFAMSPGWGGGLAPAGVPSNQEGNCGVQVHGMGELFVAAGIAKV